MHTTTKRLRDGLPGWLGATRLEVGGGCWSGSRSSHDDAAESVNSSSSSERLWCCCCCCNSVCHCCSPYNETELLFSTAPPPPPPVVAVGWWWWLWWWRRPIKSAMFGPHTTFGENTSRGKWWETTLVRSLTHTHYWLLSLLSPSGCYSDCVCRCCYCCCCLYCVSIPPLFPSCKMWAVYPLDKNLKRQTKETNNLISKSQLKKLLCDKLVALKISFF